MGRMGQGVFFSGQGAQCVGMGRVFYEHSEIMADCFNRAEQLFPRNLLTLCFEGPIEELTRTDICQMALYVVGYGAFKILQRENVLHDLRVCGGFSLGEWTALAAASAISFEDGLRAVARRAELMSQACEKNPGAMASLIGGERERIQDLCREMDVYVSNFNSPQQIVISGLRKNIAEAVARAAEFGVRRAVPLNVAGAYHSPFMQDAREQFAVFVKKLDIQQPLVPVLSNATGRAMSSPEEIRRNIVGQIALPVLWEDCMHEAWQLGVREFYECGAGKVLVGLAKKNLPEIAALSAEDWVTMA
ncbi:MAG: ACP S-malonyltransferase [Puniceicoccales bacterium]|jgi:[acyl-carrier-protein] S-malonyltransferase|nr:ACP S-malonyltransferase [Puniceicoccales bacterium]